SSNNHGFDICIGLSGDGTENGGLAKSTPGNVFIECAKNDNIQDYWKLVLVHELSHCFGADDEKPPGFIIPIDCVMDHGEENSLYPDWYVHWIGSVNQMTYYFRYN
ncbi:MAG: hypothetical protein ACTSP4_11980, partial [Candidatus Hodarchaeales archaeon]